MRVIIAALHGILTSQTDPSWPDRFSEWMYERDREAHVTTRRYWAGPFPRWNCWIKDPRLARSLANELELFLRPSSRDTRPSAPSLWFVAHSNGAVIALLAARRLIARGYRIGGLILTGAACEGDVRKNGILEWWNNGMLGAAIAYSAPDDGVLPEPPRAVLNSRSPAFLPSVFHSGFRILHSAFAWPYGCLGRTGWLGADSPESKVQHPKSAVPQSGSTPSLQPSTTPIPGPFTRWFAGGHSTYFAPAHIESTFEQIYADIARVESRASRGECRGTSRPLSPPLSVPGSWPESQLRSR